MSSLRISSTANTYIHALPPTKEEEDEMVSFLDTFYRQHALYDMFGADNIRYLCQLSARYAYWTLPPSYLRRGEMAKCHVVWLSLVWIIDGAIDNKKVTRDGADEVGQTVNAVLSGNWTQPPLPPTPTFRQALINTVGTTYTRYLALADPFRSHHPQAFDKVQQWTIKFVQSASTDTPELTSTANYEKWRLVDGAMMCVLWHSILFMSPEHVEECELLECVSLVTSYHNDILSLIRDIKNDTPNFVLVLQSEHGLSLWDAMKMAIERVNALTDGVMDLIPPLTPRGRAHVEKICLHIIEGAFAWGITEDRYHSGVCLLKCVEEDDEHGFYSLLRLKKDSVTPGDPTEHPVPMAC